MAALGRDYQAPSLKVNTQGEYTQAQVANADTRVLPEQRIGDETWRDRLLEQFGKSAIKFADKASEMEITNQYLEGQAQAGIVKSEEELQGNPLTRDWKVAGYRDTMGKLALADNDAKFNIDIKKLREQGPEALQAYLAKRRGELEPVLGSMSREARAASAGQLLLQDRTATSKWTTEHTKFITEQKVQALTTSFQVANNALSEARLGSITNGEQGQKDYQEALRNTMGLLVGATWLDSGLPDDVKQAHTMNSVSLALANDNVELYKYLNANSVPDADGTKSTLISRLSREDQIKLAGQYREAMQRTENVRSMARHEQLAQIDSQINAGTFTETYDNYNATLKEMVINGTIKGDEYQTRLTKFTDMKYKGEKSAIAAQAAQSGDIQALIGMGLTEEQGINSIQEQLVKSKASPQQQLGVWLQAGQRGSQPAYKKAGELMGFAVRQMATAKDGEVLSQHLEIFKAANNTLSGLQGEARSIARVNMLSGMSEEDRLFANQMFSLVEKGDSYDGAIATARKTFEENAKLSPSAKAAMSAVKSTDVEKAVQDITPQGLIGGLWGSLKGMFSSTAANQHALQPKTGSLFFGHPAADIMANVAKRELRLEAQDVQLIDPTADASRVTEVAMANLAARSIQTDFGPVIAPKGTQLDKMFGVGQANVSAIGPAINKLLGSSKSGSKWTLQFSEGRIWTQEYSDKGEQIGTGKYLDVQQVRDQIALTDREQSLKASWIYGRGNTVKGVREASGSIKNADGTPKVAGPEMNITYNGNSTSGAPAEWVYDFRTNLVNHEGVRGTAYKDLSGNVDKSGNPIMTVGVGVSSHNPHYPKVDEHGNITNEQATQSFNQASDDAANIGVAVSKLYNVYNPSGFKLMAELAYQSGTSFHSQDNNTGKAYRRFLGVLNTGTAAEAKEAFKHTAAWFYSRSRTGEETPRQRSYLSLIDGAMKGK